MSDKHKEGMPAPSNFCSLRIENNDPHGNTYREYDKPTPPWLRYPQAQREYDQDEKKDREAREEAVGHQFPAYVVYHKVKSKLTKRKLTKRERKWKQHVKSSKTVWKVHEAHHCVCCASVGTFIGESVIKPIIDQTDWCINQKANMVALPLWGHTFIWYCKITGGFRDIDKIEKRLGKLWIPRFKDRVMHNSDHDIYQYKELVPELEQIADEVEENTENHKECAKQLAEQLNKLVKRFSSKVRRRGRRATSAGKGTHAGWKAGLNGDKNTWYLPFSMAGKPRTRTFPLPGATGENLLKVKKHVAAFFGIK